MLEPWKRRGDSLTPAEQLDPRLFCFHLTSVNIRVCVRNDTPSLGVFSTRRVGKGTLDAACRSARITVLGIRLFALLGALEAVSNIRE